MSLHRASEMETFLKLGRRPKGLTGKGKTWILNARKHVCSPQCGLSCFSLNHLLFFTLIPETLSSALPFLSHSTDHLLIYHIMYSDSCLLQIICLLPAGKPVPWGQVSAFVYWCKLSTCKSFFVKEGLSQWSPG